MPNDPSGSIVSIAVGGAVSITLAVITFLTRRDSNRHPHPPEPPPPAAESAVTSIELLAGHERRLGRHDEQLVDHEQRIDKLERPPRRRP